MKLLPAPSIPKDASRAAKRIHSSQFQPVTHEICEWVNFWVCNEVTLTGTTIRYMLEGHAATYLKNI